MTILDEILARSRFSPTTRSAYSGVIRKWVKFAGEDPNGWTRILAQAFYESMLTNGISSTSANVYIASLRYVSKWYATKMGRPELDFAVVQTRLVAENKEPRHALTPEAAIALLNTCSPDKPTLIDLRDRTLLVIGLETGMRRMSLAGMRMENITRRDYPMIKVPIKGKGGTAVYPVPLSDTAMLVLDAWRAQLSPDSIRNGPVFPSYAGNKMAGSNDGLSMQMIYKLIVDRAKSAGISHVHPHIIRHSFITWRQLAGLNAIQIASITGHKTLGAEWANMVSYIDLASSANEARNSTPLWLADLVRSWR